MQPFRSVHSAIHAGVAGLCWWVLHNIGELQVKLVGYEQYAVPAALAGLGLLFRTSDKLAGVVVEKIPLFSKLLRRVLSGRNFIEGDWPLIVVDMEKVATGAPTLIYLGHLRIDFRGSQLHVQGDDWNPDGSHAHAFRSEQSRYDNGLLQYWYKQGEADRMRCYTEIYFFPKDGGLAVRNAGKFLDPSHTSDIRFYSVRYPGGLFGGLRTREAKLKAAGDLWARLEPELGRLKTQAISVDFA